MLTEVPRKARSVRLNVPTLTAVNFFNLEIGFREEIPVAPFPAADSTEYVPCV